MQNQSTNQQPQNNEGIMQQPPHVITTKDFAYINDMLAWNLLAMKKAHFAASQCQDQQIKSLLDQSGHMHQRHYEKILGHLNENLPGNSMM